jgi:hypothetical protein
MEIAGQQNLEYRLLQFLDATMNSAPSLPVKIIKRTASECL